MSAMAKLWYKKCLKWIEEGMTIEEAVNQVPERWREEVREALENDLA